MSSDHDECQHVPITRTVGVLQWQECDKCGKFLDEDQSTETKPE